MKKNHSQQHQINPEALYAQVNKPRKVQRPPHPETTAHADVNVRGRGRSPRPEEIIYADINVGGRGSRSHSEETVYADINVGGRGRRSHSEEAVYADINVGGRGRRSHSEETIYADVNVGGHNNRSRPEEIIYADVNVGGHNNRSRPEEIIYADVNVGGRNNRSRPEETVYASVSKTTTPLTKGQIATRLLKEQDVQHCSRAVQELCNTVYGNQHALNKELAAILENPNNGESVLRKVAENPEGPSPLRGREVFGIKSPARKEAEEKFSSLYDALNNYIHTVQKGYRGIVCEHDKQQKHERKGGQERQLERRAHHHAKEKQQAVGEQSVQQRKHSPKQGMAMAM